MMAEPSCHLSDSIRKRDGIDKTRQQIASLQRLANASPSG
jgi:hypothetical protein